MTKGLKTIKSKSNNPKLFIVNNAGNNVWYDMIKT